MTLDLYTLRDSKSRFNELLITEGSLVVKDEVVILQKKDIEEIASNVHARDKIGLIDTELPYCNFDKNPRHYVVVNTSIRQNKTSALFIILHNGEFIVLPSELIKNYYVVGAIACFIEKQPIAKFNQFN